MKKRSLSLIIVLVMVLGMMPGTGLLTEVRADETKTITLGAGGLTAGNKVYFGNQYKLTLADTSRTIGITSGKALTRDSATSVIVPYTIDSGSNHVSLLITNKDDTWTAESGWSEGAVKQYYTTAAVTGTSGTVTFTLPDDYEANKDNWKAWILAEQVNGEKETDYASAPVGITIPAQTIGGSCGKEGDNVTWTLEDGTLTISGNGAMADYSTMMDVPWYANQDNITTVVINEGVTTVGDLAFYDCNCLSSVTIPDGITSIGWSAFCNTALDSVAIPGSVESIGDGAFFGCTSLTSIVIPTSVTSIGDNAFNDCVNLMSIVAPLSMKAKLPVVDNNCWLVVDQAGAGVVSGKFNEDGTATLTATANEGFTFVNWINDNGEVSDDNPYTFTPTNGMTLTANFIQTIGKADQIAPEEPIEESVTSTTVTLKETAGYQYSKDKSTWQDSNIFDNLTASTSYTFYQRVAGDENHNPSPESAGTKITTTQYTLVYDPGEGTGTMDPEGVSDNDTYKFPECGFDAPEYKTFDHWKMSGVDGIFYPGKTVTIASNCADTDGIITVTAHWKSTNSATVTIAPAAKTLTYNGNAQELVTAGKAQNGTMNYALGDSTTTAPTEGWSESVSTGTDAGTYYVWYKAKGDSSHTDSDPQCITANISKRSVTLKSEGGDKPYDGSALTKPEVSGWEQDDKNNTGFIFGEVSDVKATGSVTTVAEGEVTNAITYKEGSSFKADNYTITKTEGVLKITQKAVTVTVTAVDRDYEAGNTSVSITAGTVDGAVAVDNVTVDVSAASGTMEDDNAGTNKPVTVTGVKLGGTDAGNYTLSGQPKDVAVTINKIPDPAVITGTATVTVGGNSIDLGNNVAGAAGEVSYAFEGEANGCTLAGSSLTSGDETGECQVKVTVAESANHTGKTGNITVTITEKKTEGLAVAQEGTVYGTALPDPVWTRPEDPVKDAAISYSGTTTAGVEYKDSQKPTEAGNYAVSVTEETSDTIYSGSAGFIIEKADPEVTAPTAIEGLVYNGEAQQLVTAGSVAGGEMQYAIGADAATDPGGWSPAIPTGTGAGTYYVWYKAAGDANHNDSDPGCVTAAIAASYKVTFAVTGGSWDDGTAENKTVTLTGPAGEELKLTEDQIPAAGSKPAAGYEAGGWDVTPNTETAITEDTTYIYTYAKSKFTITFVNGGTVLQSSEMEYGETPEYKGEEPTKAATEQYTYTFAGWEPEIVPVTGEATYTAAYNSVVNQYNVTFVDYDGETVLKEATAYDYGTPADKIARPADPTRKDDAEYSYTFAGWTPEIAAVTGDVTYKATYTATKKARYVVTEGEGSEYKQGSDGTLTFVFKRSENDENTYDHFTGAKYDGKVLTREKDYRAARGSVIIELQNSFLKGLPVGKHTLTAVFDDGEVTAKFEVVEKKTPTVTPNSKNPATGDENNTTQWIILILSAAFVMSLMILIRMRKEKK